MYDSLVDNSRYITERVQLRHEMLLIYKQTEYSSNCRVANRFDLTSNKHIREPYSGDVTLHARKRITQAVHKLLMISPAIKIINPITMKRESFTVNFITLTIPCTMRMINAQEGYLKLLAPFLRTMKRKYNLKSYIWKAEVQSRGQLHYHIIGNVWINWTSIRYEWNYLLSTGGYMEEYKLLHGSSNPNSIDVHKIYKIRNVANYLCKYIAKNVKKSNETDGNCSVKKQVLNSKVWDCSKNLKAYKLPSLELDVGMSNELRKLVLASKVSDEIYDTCSILKPINCQLLSILPESLKMLNKEFVNNIKSIQNENKIE